jgi:hypothetical protein
VSPQVVALLIVLGAGAIAVWLHVRFPAAAPESFRGGFFHLGASTLVASFLLAPGLALAELVARPGGMLLAVFGVAFPILVYCLLASIWVLRLASGMLPTRR